MDNLREENRAIIDRAWTVDPVRFNRSDCHRTVTLLDIGSQVAINPGQINLIMEMARGEGAVGAAPSRSGPKLSPANRSVVAANIPGLLPKDDRLGDRVEFSWEMIGIFMDRAREQGISQGRTEGQALSREGGLSDALEAAPSENTGDAPEYRSVAMDLMASATPAPIQSFSQWFADHPNVNGRPLRSYPPDTLASYFAAYLDGLADRLNQPPPVLFVPPMTPEKLEAFRQAFPAR